MKKYISIVAFAVVSLVLSGCSLAPSIEKKAAEPVANPANSVWASFDSGKTWLNNFLPNGKTDLAAVDVLSMAINPFDAKNVYVGTKGGGLLKTENGGDEWVFLKFQSEKVYGLDIDPVDGKIIYASGVWEKRGKIFKSLDAGENWTEIYTTPSAGPIVISLVVDKKNAKIIYATTSDNQVITTTDGGNSWRNIFVAPSPVLKVVLDSRNSNLIYALMQNGEILRSKEKGKNFENLSKLTGIKEKSVRSASLLEADPNNGDWVYAAGYEGLFKSKDAGNTWEKIEVLSNSQNFPVKALAINPTNSREIVYGAAQAAYYSIDGGVNWETFQFNIAKSVKIIKYADVDPTNLYMGFSK